MDLKHAESFKIKEDNKFFTRLMSKESSMEKPSFRVYYGGACGSVPFTWESQPGTPKHTSASTTPPPLTPPPSYCARKQVKKSLRAKLIAALIPKLSSLRKSSCSSTSSPLSSFSSSSSSSASNKNIAPMDKHRHSMSSRGYDSDSDSDEGRSPTSTLCFGLLHGTPGVATPSRK